MTTKMVGYNSRDSSYGSNEKRGVEHSSKLANTLRRLKVEIRSCVKKIMIESCRHMRNKQKSMQ